MKISVCLAAKLPSNLPQLAHANPQLYAKILAQIAAHHGQDAATATANLERLLAKLEASRYRWLDGSRAGKAMPGIVYLGRSEEWRLPQPLLAAAKSHLPVGWSYAVVAWRKKTNKLHFVRVPDWDTATEPQRQPNSSGVSSVGVTTTGTVSTSRDTQIYHHKWQFVSDSSTDFGQGGVEASKLRSLLWLTAGTNDDYTRIGRADYWQSHVVAKLGDPPPPVQPAPPNLELWPLTAPGAQLVSSAETSGNRPAATFKLVAKFGGWRPNTINADLGGGKYNEFTKKLATVGVTNVIYDPYNRSSEHNRAAVAAIANGKAHTVTVNNVLNVIREPWARDHLVRQAANALSPTGTAYFLIYAGGLRGGTGFGSYTSKGWQHNRAAGAYKAEVERHFDTVRVRGKLITATNPKR